MKKERCEKRESRNVKSKKIFAISQILSLVLEIFAFLFMFSVAFGFNVEIISAETIYIGSTTPQILGGDRYTVVGYDASSQMIELKSIDNPGVTTSASLSTLRQNYNLDFSTQSPASTPQTLQVGDVTGQIRGGDIYKVVNVDSERGEVVLYSIDSGFVTTESMEELKQNYNLEFTSTATQQNTQPASAVIAGGRQNIIDSSIAAKTYVPAELGPDNLEAQAEQAILEDEALNMIREDEARFSSGTSVEEISRRLNDNTMVVDTFENGQLRFSQPYYLRDGQWYRQVGESASELDELMEEDEAAILNSRFGRTAEQPPAENKGWFSSLSKWFETKEVPANWGQRREFDTIFGERTTSPMAGHLLEGVQWAGIVLGSTSTIANFMTNEDTKSLVKAIGLAASAGILAYKTSMGLFETFAKDRTSWGARYGNAVSIGIGLITAYYLLAENYEETEIKQQTINFKCFPWQAPNGGADCDECNGDPFRPCSEYRCKALGQTCKLINAGTGKERCIDGAVDDVTSPGIKPYNEALTQGYSYTDVKIRPPGGQGPAGMKIVSQEGGCLKAFTPFTFGIITTDKKDNGVITQPAQCKIDMNHTNKFDEMQYYLGGDNLYTEYHNESISLPGTELLNRQFPEIKNDGEYTMYIRCKDGNGNENRDEFAVRFCIDKTPDLTAPVIKTTSIPSNSPVLYKIDNLSVNVYTNEPSSCKWSRKDADYSNMENNMICNNAVWEMNAEMLYTCQAQLTGIKDKEDNQFYFRCQDLSNNVMQQSYAYNIIGTQPLTILKAGPNQTTIGGSTNTIVTTLEVQTDGGFRNGEAECYYSTTNNSGYIKFFETGGSLHKQNLDLVNGQYTYYYKCVDAGGNTAFSSASFKVFVDKFAPVIARVYSLEGKLVVVTDENATCSYSANNCNFDLTKKEGVDMPY
ncbi:hypothetical protein FJZ17_03195, partial [Candidatus Pacearchaeota archaeon]|nr:hypothetical protein [Candidatus Pacearchaeota archaeon]